MSELIRMGMALVVLAPWIGLGESSVVVPETGEWEKRVLTREFWAEGACVADVDRDGELDVLSGPYWYAGPGFTARREIYPATQRFETRGADGSRVEVGGFKGFLSGENGYAEVFLSYAMDVNGDGWMDYIAVGHPGKETWWYENPRGGAGHWRRRLVLAETDNESPQLVDVTGDGRPELICMNGGRLGYASPVAGGMEEPWEFHAVTGDRGWKWNTHGLGHGDVNGDGRVDLITCVNWWEQPEGGGLWRQHDWEFGEAAAQMFATDVNGDGVADVVASWNAHGYGVAWHEQRRTGGKGGWTRHMIAGRTAGEGAGLVFSQPHALALADMNGDGLPDIVTGKRFWAHGPKGDEEPNAAAVLVWFELRRAGGRVSYAPHVIDDDSGVGTQVTVADVNRDGKLDVVVGNKKGLFVFLRK